MCYIVCREIDINAVYVALEPLHRIEIDLQKCTYPGWRHLYEVQPARCTGCGECLEYCPAPGALVQYELAG